MAIRRFSGSWKTRDDVMDNITPNNVVQPNVSVPAGEWKPAAWLPIVWTGEASKDSFVISSGKVVAFDRDGRIVPAGYKRACADASATSDVIVTYTSADADAGVIDVETGSAVSAAKTVTIAELATALLGRGLVAESEVADADFAAGNIFDAGELADCQLICDLFFSDPIGVCAYDVYVWAGDSAEELNFLNYQKQHLIQFFTDMQMQVPHAALATQTTDDISTLQDWDAADGNGEVFPDGADAGEELFMTEADLASFARYADLSPMTNVVGIALEHNPVAVNTDRTPITSTSTILSRERTSYNKLAKAGDWYLDAEVGILFLFSADGTSAPASQTITYYHYDSSESSAERQVCVVGEVLPGDRLTYDRYSNFVKASPVTISSSEGGAASGDADDTDVLSADVYGPDVVGRVLAVVSQPKGLLDRVRTAWDGSSFSSTEQMPGTATAGYSDLITLSPENVSGTSGVADQVVLINVKMS